MSKKVSDSDSDEEFLSFSEESKSGDTSTDDLFQDTIEQPTITNQDENQRPLATSDTGEAFDRTPNLSGDVEDKPLDVDVPEQMPTAEKQTHISKDPGKSLNKELAPKKKVSNTVLFLQNGKPWNKVLVSEQERPKTVPFVQKGPLVRGEDIDLAQKLSGEHEENPYESPQQLIAGQDLDETINLSREDEKKSVKDSEQQLTEGQDLDETINLSREDEKKPVKDSEQQLTEDQDLDETINLSREDEKQPVKDSEQQLREGQDLDIDKTTKLSVDLKDNSLVSEQPLTAGLDPKKPSFMAMYQRKASKRKVAGNAHKVPAKKRLLSVKDKTSAKEKQQKKILCCSTAVNVENKVFSCDKCNVTYTSPLYLEVHEKKCRGSRTVKTVKPSLEPTNVQQLAMMVDGRKTYCCNLCDYKNAKGSEMKRHMMTHSDVKPHKCNDCGKGFTRAQQLVRHKRVHTGDRPYKCDQCPYAATQSSALRRHMTQHSGEKVYACTECNYKTAVSSSMRNHSRTHSGDRPYCCTVCSYRAAQRYSLILHMRTHTGEKPHACPHCQYRAAVKGNLNSHMARLHPDLK